MVKQVVHWETEDGEVFDTERKAELHEELHMKMKLIGQHGIPHEYINTVMYIVQEHTKGWK